KVLDHKVGRLDQLQEQVAAALVLEVERDAAFTAVGHGERVALTVDLRAEPARVVAGDRLLDLDDGGAQLCENHRAVGARQEASQVEDAEAVQRKHSHLPVLWDSIS